MFRDTLDHKTNLEDEQVRQSVPSTGGTLWVVSLKAGINITRYFFTLTLDDRLSLETLLIGVFY